MALEALAGTDEFWFCGPPDPVSMLWARNALLMTEWRGRRMGKVVAGTEECVFHHPPNEPSESIYGDAIVAEPSK